MGGDRRETFIRNVENEMVKELSCLLCSSSRCLSLPICEVWVIMSLFLREVMGKQ